jgi:hypothetical protein
MPTTGHIRYALLAQHVVDHGGLVSMLNAGWTRLEMPLPGPALVTIVAQAAAVDAGGVIMCEIVAPSGDVLASTSSLVTGLTVPPDGLSAVTIPMVLTIPMMISESGCHKVRFSGAVEHHEVDFWVVPTR